MFNALLANMVVNIIVNYHANYIVRHVNLGAKKRRDAISVAHVKCVSHHVKHPAKTHVNVPAKWDAK